MGLLQCHRESRGEREPPSPAGAGPTAAGCAPTAAGAVGPAPSSPSHPPPHADPSAPSRRVWVGSSRGVCGGNSSASLIYVRLGSGGFCPGGYAGAATARTGGGWGTAGGEDGWGLRRGRGKAKAKERERKGKGREGAPPPPRGGPALPCLPLSALGAIGNSGEREEGGRSMVGGRSEGASQGPVTCTRHPPCSPLFLVPLPQPGHFAGRCFGAAPAARLSAACCNLGETGKVAF